MNQKDALQIEYSELRQQLSGISPKLSKYAEIKARMKEIEKYFEENGGEVGFTRGKTTGKERSSHGKIKFPWKVHG